MKNKLIQMLVGACCGLLVVSACCKEHPAGDEQVPVVFSALSDTAPVKTRTGTSKSFPHESFGIWGIARKTEAPNYVLWDETTLAKVTRVNNTNNFQPTSNAYWISGYRYLFLALAPYGATTATVIPGLTENPPYDAMTFSYDLAADYTAGRYDFDLMAAVATNEVVGAAASHPSSQPLSFVHLFSQININVTFGDGVTGRVDNIRLTADTDADYTVTFLESTDESGNLTLNRSVTCDAGTAALTTLTFRNQNAISVNIIPQPVSADSNLQLSFDYTINPDTANAFTFTNIVLDPALGGVTAYNPNESYNWNITIGPKEDISFKVTVDQWTTVSVSDGDSDDNNDIEIP